MASTLKNQVSLISRQEFDRVSISTHRAAGLKRDRVLRDVEQLRISVLQLQSCDRAVERAKDAHHETQKRFEGAFRTVELHVHAWPENRAMKQLNFLLHIARPLLHARG